MQTRQRTNTQDENPKTRKHAKAIVTLNRPMIFKSIFSFNKSLLGTKTPSLSAKKNSMPVKDFYFSKVLKKQKKCQLEKQTRFGKEEVLKIVVGTFRSKLTL